MSALTETEARGKWCPFARQNAKDEPGGTYNRNDSGSGAQSCRCLASDCMAWRWSADDKGYCGLAGHPNAAP